MRKSSPFKKKKTFLIMFLFFSALVIAGLGFMWSQPALYSPHAAMMGNSMGAMMRNEWGSITLADLFRSEPYMKSDMASHHQGGTIIAKTHLVTTTVIVVLLPLIMGGLAFLVILWL